MRIGVVPACAERPVIATSVHEMPCTPSTTPIVDALVLEDRTLLDVQLDVGVRERRPPGTAAARRSRCASARRRGGRRRRRRGRRAPPPAPCRPTYTRLPSMSGAKRAPSSSVKNATLIGCARSRRRAARASRAPRARRARRGCRRSGRQSRTVSMCEPVITGAASASRPGRVATTLPISSIVTRGRGRASTHSRGRARRGRRR